MEAEYQARIEQLQRQLHMAKLAFAHYASAGTNGTGNHMLDNKDENVSWIVYGWCGDGKVVKIWKSIQM